MNLPYKDQAIVEREKVRDYLLSPSHPTGQGKAEFFNSMGFQREAWEVLADALRQVARDCPVTKSMTSLLVNPSSLLQLLRRIDLHPHHPAAEGDERGQDSEAAQPQCSASLGGQYMNNLGHEENH